MVQIAHISIPMEQHFSPRCLPMPMTISVAALPPNAQPGDSTPSRPLPINDPPWSAAASPDGVSTVRWNCARGLGDWLARCETVKEWPLEHGPFVVMPMANNAGVFAIGCDHVLHSLQLNMEADASVRIKMKERCHPGHSDYFADEQVLAIYGSTGVSVFQLGRSHRKLQHIRWKQCKLHSLFSRRKASGRRHGQSKDWRYGTGKASIGCWKLPTRGTCSSMDFSSRWALVEQYRLFTLLDHSISKVMGDDTPHQ